MLMVHGALVGGRGAHRVPVGDLHAAVEHLQQTVADQAAIFAGAARPGIELDPPIAGEAIRTCNIGPHHASAPLRCSFQITPCRASWPSSPTPPWWFGHLQAADSCRGRYRPTRR